jgi:hypothetical protein
MRAGYFLNRKIKEIQSLITCRGQTKKNIYFEKEKKTSLSQHVKLTA